VPALPRFAAHAVFYPAAALYAALALPASVLAMARGWSPLAHAHEMLLGFALAVVAGNQLGVLPRWRMLAMLAVWAAARIAFVLAPGSAAAIALNAAFALLLGIQVVPRLFGAAKKLRNRALPAILAGLCAAAALWRPPLVLPLVVLFSLLMLFMGGRIIAPAVAGQLHRQGERLDARVQPRIEGALLLAGALALTQVFPLAPAALATAGALAALRLARWRLWRLRGRPDLLCLAAGYAWLALGLLALGAALAAGRHVSAAIHLVTVGALGTLTFNVMALSWLLKARRSPEGSRTIVAGTLLIAAAAALRLLASFHAGPWLYAAAGCWAAAFALLVWLFARTPRRSRTARSSPASGDR
jgi:uncharacterized protein involved in response to NO